ncbi:MAG: tRNA (adenosine(37)-N6)-threonylcarbamoyltransferase complex ATPase subunit type 1 TsaE [Alphaproteobacteria bacterium]
MKTIISKSESDTARAAQDLAQTLKSGDILLLHGTLGAGKTALTRALIRSLSNTPTLEVLSPTFTLLQTYDTDKGEVHHYDLYRLEDPEEILQIGWEESLYNTITIVEWPERLGAYKPQDSIDITITIDDNTKNRTITINRHPAV